MNSELSPDNSMKLQIRTFTPFRTDATTSVALAWFV
jgi:hypothetical protein